MFKAVSIGWLAKLTVIVLTLVNTRLLVDLVGLQGLAAYAIIISLTTWISLFNLGIPYAVQSLIAKHKAETKSYQDLKTTAISLVLILLVLLLPVMAVVSWGVKSFLLSQFSFATTPLVFFACFLILLSGLTQILVQILFAEHRPLWPNIFPAIISIASFLGLWILQYAQIVSFDYVLLISLLPHALVFTIAFFQLEKFSKLAIKREPLIQIFQTARGFLVFAILSAGTLAVDYIVMSRLLPAHDIATYNLLAKIFGVILSIHAVLLANAWPHMSDQLHAARFNEARQKMRQLLLLGLAGAAVAIVMLSFSLNWMMRLLAGEQAFVVPMTLFVLWSAYIVLRIWSDTYAMGLMSFNKMKRMNTYIPFQAAISLAAQLLFGYWLGLPGILIGLIASFILTACWILPIHFYKNTNHRLETTS